MRSGGGPWQAPKNGNPCAANNPSFLPPRSPLPYLSPLSAASLGIQRGRSGPRGLDLLSLPLTYMDAISATSPQDSIARGSMICRGRVLMLLPLARPRCGAPRHGGAFASPSSFPSSLATLGGRQGGFGPTGLGSAISVSFTGLRDGGRSPFGRFPSAEFHVPRWTHPVATCAFAVLPGAGVST